MSNPRNELIKKLNKLFNESSNHDIKRTAGLALAALETNKSATSLTGLIGDKLNKFNPDNGNGALSTTRIRDAVSELMTTNLVEQGLFSTQEQMKGMVNRNLLNQLAFTISSCVEGKLSQEVCKSTLENASEKLENQMVNLKLALTTLKSLGFRIHKEDSVLVAGTDKVPQVESVKQWQENNKDKLPKLNPSLVKVLETLVLTVNAYAREWEGDKLVPVVLSKKSDDTTETKNNAMIILGIQSHLDGLTGLQKYYSGLIPIKAQKLGLLSMEGGAGFAYASKRDADGNIIDGLYNSYVDEEVDTNKHFYTADVLEKFLDKYLKIFEKRNVKLEDSEVSSMKENLQKLKRDEVALVEVSAVIEKYLALRKYFGITDSVKNMEEMTSLLTEHKNKLTKVEKRRKGLGNILYAFARQIDIGF